MLVESPSLQGKCIQILNPRLYLFSCTECMAFYLKNLKINSWTYSSSHFIPNSHTVTTQAHHLMLRHPSGNCPILSKTFQKLLSFLCVTVLQVSGSLQGFLVQRVDLCLCQLVNDPHWWHTSSYIPFKGMQRCNTPCVFSAWHQLHRDISKRATARM